jgi:hypothetical protein
MLVVVGGVVLDIFGFPQAEYHNVAPTLCELFSSNLGHSPLGGNSEC